MLLLKHTLEYIAVNNIRSMCFFICVSGQRYKLKFEPVLLVAMWLTNACLKLFFAHLKSNWSRVSSFCLLWYSCEILHCGLQGERGAV